MFFFQLTTEWHFKENYNAVTIHSSISILTHVQYNSEAYGNGFIILQIVLAHHSFN